MVGWLLVVSGIIALVIPGPGLLLLLAGLVVLAQEYEWARRRLRPVRIKAYATAAESVKSWPRICGSALGGLALIGIGVIWALDPTIPQFWIFGPELPFGGLATGLTLGLSGVIALATIVYSYRHFRGHSAEEVRHLAQEKAPRG